MLSITGRYPPARAELRKALANVEVLKADLTDLTRLDQIGAAAWRVRYDADLSRLTAASNTLRTALGLPATRS